MSFESDDVMGSGLCLPPQRPGRKQSIFQSEANASRLKALLSKNTSVVRTYSDQPSDAGPVVKKPPKKYQNTYKLEPDTRFPVGKVETIAEDVLRQFESSKAFTHVASVVARDKKVRVRVFDREVDGKDHLEDVEYDESVGRRLVKVMSDKILQAVKGLDCKRHKIVALVNIGQLNGQGIRFGSRCLWQPQHDNFAEACYEGRTLWATATVYGVYQD